MKLRHTILLLLPTLMLIGGCKKYEEGPAFSIVPVKQRVMGMWAYELILFDGIDSTEHVKSTYGDCHHLINRDSDNFMFSFCDCNPFGGCPDAGTWSLKDKNTLLRLTLLWDSYLGRTLAKGNVDFNILRLTSKELWVDVDLEGKIEIHFNKLNN